MRPETKIHLQKLSVHSRGSDYVVGYEPAKAYITVDKEGLDVIEDLKTHTIAQTQRKHPQYDVKHIIAQLTENGLVHKINHRVVNKATPVQDILNIPTAALTWVHHPLTRGTLLGLLGVLFILYLTQHTLIPQAEWFFATQWLSLLIPGAFVAVWVLHFLHELGHYAAIKATGHQTGFHLAHRWHLLVPEADLTNVNMLTAAQQTRVYLAGLAIDLMVLVLATILITFGIAPAFWQLIALLVWISILIQALPLAYTDAAKIAERITKNKEVLWHAKQSLKTFCLFCSKKLDQQHERLRANLLPWMLTGMFVGATLVIVYIIPIVYELFAQAAQALFHAARTSNTPQLIDASIALLLLAVFVSMYSVSAIREHHLGTRNWFTWLCVAFFITANFIVVTLLGVVVVLTASPIIAALAFILLGTIFGSLFISLMDHIQLERTGFATDAFLPIYAASTAILLVLLFAAIPSTQGAETIYGIAYAVGMLGSLVS